MSGVAVHSLLLPGGKDVAGIAVDGQVVEVFRWMNGVDVVKAFGRLWTPNEADTVGRLICGAASMAAAYNAGAIR